MKLDKSKWKPLSQRQRMSPFPNYMSMEAVCGRMKHYLGVNLSRIILFFEDRIMDGFIEKKQFETANRFILERIKREPKLYSELISQQNFWGNKLASFAKDSAKQKLNKINDKRLFELFEKYNDLYREVYAIYGSVWVVENVLNEELLKIVQARITNFAKAANTLNLLTLQPSAMVARIEREALYKLASAISLKLGWIKQIESGLVSDKKLLDLIKSHEKNYFWVTRDYEDPILTSEKIVKRLQEIPPKTASKIYGEMVKERLQIPKDQKNTESGLRLSKFEKNLFTSMRNVAHLKELRKRYVSESLFYFDPVLMEIGRRSGLSLKQVRFLRTKDVNNILLKKNDFTDETNNRIKLSAWVTKGLDTEVYTRKTAQDMYKTLVVFDKNAREFQGMPVSPGIARGPVRIIMNPDEINKVKKGDIIVSVQVVPSFSPAIHRAAGLICDGGHGITTHPAILAREAKIPAIIQTFFARKILKDGDMVEVDGFKGIARKLN